MIIRKETWKVILKIAISVLTAIGASLGINSCMYYFFCKISISSSGLAVIAGAWWGDFGFLASARYKKNRTCFTTDPITYLLKLN